MSNINVVVPTIRAEQITKFLEAWQPIAKQSKHNVHFIIVEDNPKKSFSLPEDVTHYSWKEIDKDLGKNAWIIPRRSDCIRSYGFLKSSQKDLFGYTVTLDDDVRPPQDWHPNYFDTAIELLETDVPLYTYFNTGDLLFGTNLYMRGFPFKQRGKKASVDTVYGMWENVPDFDGITQLAHKRPDGYSATWETKTAPLGAGITGCIMNMAFHNLNVGTKYQLLMGKNEPFDRWGDIWSGLFIKRIADIRKDAIVFSGSLLVNHTRASNVHANIMKEASGYTVNEVMWERLQKWQPTIDEDTNDDTLYLSLADFIVQEDLFNNPEYSAKVSKAMKIWIEVTNRC